MSQDNDKTKVARVIADMLGVENAEKMSPEAAIQAGLRNMKHKKMTPEMTGVIKKMVALAQTVGVKVDESVIAEATSRVLRYKAFDKMQNLKKGIEDVSGEDGEAVALAVPDSDVGAEVHTQPGHTMHDPSDDHMRRRKVKYHTEEAITESKFDVVDRLLDIAMWNEDAGHKDDANLLRFAAKILRGEMKMPPNASKLYSDLQDVAIASIEEKRKGDAYIIRTAIEYLKGGMILRKESVDLVEYETHTYRHKDGSIRRRDDEGNEDIIKHSAQSAANAPRTHVHINGKRWKSFDSESEARRVGKAVAAKHPGKRVELHFHEEVAQIEEGRHRVSVTVSDPQHTMVTKRGDKIEKRVSVRGNSKEDAVAAARMFYKKKGYRVHDAFYHSAVNEEVELAEDLKSADTKVGPSGKKYRAHTITFHNSSSTDMTADDPDAEDHKEKAKAPKMKPLVKEESSDDDDNNELDSLSDDELDSMADEVDDEDDILHVYDDEEFHVVDDETGEVVDEDDRPVSEGTINEVLSRSERLRARARFARTAAKRERRLVVVLRKRSDNKTINKRARRLAVKMMKEKLMKKKASELSVGEKERVERMIASRKGAVDRMALRLVPRIRKIESERLSHPKATQQSGASS